MKTNEEILKEIAKAQDILIKNWGVLCGIDDEQIHVTNHFFKEIFGNDIKFDGKNDRFFSYSAEKYGIKIICLSIEELPTINE